MKTRHCRPLRPTTTPTASFALHPLCLASLIALSGPVLALPQGAVVAGGKVTVTKPTPTQQIITQGTQKAIVDWTSFSIAAGEKVRFDQPSSSAVILNRVTGTDPSGIFGHLESNGRVFLLNPYGVVFGANARVDVGGLLASSLSLSNADFNAGRLRLSSNEAGLPGQRGEVRNDGVISAPDGTVVLAAPRVTNTGTIEARGGRVGLVAAQDVLVDVEGDGLIFFQASATDARNRLAQLGRVQADGGSVELRAAARGAFADTVLNMSGIVQARSLGLQQGRVVIDGGAAGITRVAGTVDTSGTEAGERGGQISVRGQKVLLDLAAVLDASGHAGGGKATVGGEWQGQGPEANAQMTHVARGARIDVSATGNGDGGTAVVWSDESTRFLGHVAARGGAAGGNGGRIEVSGKKHLGFDGSIDVAAPAGRSGSLLLDPTDIRITDDTDDDVNGDTGSAPFTLVGNEDTSNLQASKLVGLLEQGSGANVTVNANAAGGGGGTITIETGVAWDSGGSLTLLATGGISSTGSGTITNQGTGGLTLRSNGNITLGAAVTLAGGAFTVAGTTGGTSSAASFTAGDITTSGPALSGRDGGDVTIRATGNITTGVIAARGGSGASATLQSQTGGAGGNGGVVLLRTTTAGTIETAGINTTGGAGGIGGPSGQAGPPTEPAGDGGDGGNAGTITLAATGANRGVELTGSLLAQGGAGGAVDNSGGGGGSVGDGGNGGAVNVSSAAGTVSVVGITSARGGAGGSNANITLSAGTNLSVGGVLNTGGGGTTRVDLEFGRTNAGGVLQLPAASDFNAATVRAEGGSGNDRIEVALDTGNLTLDDTTLSITSKPAITVADVERVDVTGSASDNNITLTGWAGTAFVTVSGGTDVLIGNGSGTRLIGPTAGDYAITGANAGSVAGTGFTEVGTIQGGSGADTFTLAAGVASFAGTLLGGGGSNTLVLTDGANTITLSAANAGTLNTTTPFSGIATLTGGSGTDTLSAGTFDTTYSITGANAVNVAGVQASSIDALLGSTGADTFTLATGVSGFNGSINGAGGTNTLAVTNGTNTFAVGGANSGTLNTSTTFTNIASLGGGSGDDTFSFAAPAAADLTGSIAGGAGTNTLDLSAKAGTLVVNQSGTATHAGAALFTGFSGIDVLAGNGTATTLVGLNTAQTYTLAGNQAGSVAGLAFSGVTTLSAGSAADTLVVANDVASITLSNATIARSGLADITLSGFESASLSGGAGNNTITASAFSGTVSVLASAGTDSVIGNGTNTTLVGTNNDSTFTITGARVGTLEEGANVTTMTSGVGHLVGGTGNDTFRLAAGITTFNGSLAGGAGSNTLELANGANTITLSGTGAGTLNTTTTFSGIATLTGGSGTDTLSAGTFDTTYSITGANAVNVAGVQASSIDALLGSTGADTFTLATGVSGFNGSINGAGGTNTLAVTNGTNTFAVDGANSGTLNTSTTFTNIASLGGGSGDDTFSFAAPAAADLTGSIAGGAGTNTLDLSAKAGTLVVNQSGTATHAGAALFTGFSGIDVLAGNGTATTLVGLNTAQTYTLAGNQAGSVAGLAFSGVTTLSAGSAADTFTLAAGVASFEGTLLGGGGSNTLVLTDGANTITLSAANAGTLNTTTTFSGIATLTGGSGTDTLSAGTFDTTYSITGANAVNVAGVQASSIDALLGSTGADTFTLATGVSGFNGSINGAGGTNTLAVTNGTNTFAVGGANSGTLNTSTTFTNIASLGGGSGDDTFSFAAPAAADLTGSIAGGAGTNTLDLSAKAGTLVVNQSGTATHAGAALFTGFSGIDVLAGNGTATTLVGLNTAQTYTLAGNQAGSVAGLAFSGVTTLSAGSAADTLVVANDVASITLSNATIARSGLADITLSGFESASLSGGAGNNTITASAFSGTVSVLASAGTDSVIGNGTNTTLVGTAVGSTFTVSGDDTGSLVQGLDGTTFSSVGSLRGGAGNDTFAIQDAGTLSGGIDGGGGTNRLDLSQKLSATIILNQGSSTVSGVGVAGAITNIATTIGNGANTTLQGDNTGQAFAITAENEITVDGSEVFQGVGNLNAGSGADSISGTTFRLTGNIVDAGGANTLSGTLITGGGQNYAGAVTAANPLALEAGSNIAATNAANNFSTLSVTTSGSAGVAIVDANSLVLGNISLLGSGANSLTVGTAAGSTLSRTGTLVVANAPTLTFGGVTINSGVRNLFTTGAATSVQIRAGAAGTHDLTATGVSLLPGMTVTGNLDLTSAAGTDITQAGALTVNGSTSISASAGNITLASAGNDFRGAVNLSGASTQVRDTNALTLGTLDTGALSATSSGALVLGQGNVGGNLTAASNGGAVTQAGALDVTGSTSITAGAGNITLASAGNDFRGAVNLSGASTQVRDANALTLGTLDTGALSATSSGALVLGQGSVGGNLTAASNGGAVTQDGALDVTGSTSISAGAGNITLNSAGNDFRGAVNLSGGSTQVRDTNALTLGTLDTGALSATSSGALVLGQGNVGGNFGATSNGGAISQTAALDVTGSTSISAGAGSITLASAGNDFHGAVNLSGASTQVRDANALTLGTLDTGALSATSSGALVLGQGNVGGNFSATSNGGAVSQTAALDVIGSTSISAGAGNITLASAGNDFRGAVNLSGASTQVRDANALTLGTLDTGALSATSSGALVLGQGNVGGNLTAASNGGAVTQAGALDVTGSTSISAGAGNITLASAGNDFHGAVNLSGGSTQVRDANALNLASVSVAAGRSLSVTAGGTITLANDITTTADQTFAGNVVLAGDVALAAGPGRVDLQGNVNGGGHQLTLSSTATAPDAIDLGGAITNTASFAANGSIRLGGSVTTAGDQTYTGPVQLAGAATLTGANLNLLGSIDGAHTLTLAGSGTTTLGGAVGAGTALAAIADNGVGTTRLGASVTTTGTQDWGGALQLTGASTLTGSTLTFGGTIDGAHALSVLGSGSTAIFNAAVGGTTALASLNVNGPAQINAGAVRTSGGQRYVGAVTLGADTVLSGTTISLAGSLDGAHALTLNNTGTASFAGAVGATTALSALTQQGAGALTLTNASIRTTGAQRYASRLQTTGDTRLIGSELHLGAGVSGAQDLDLRTNTLSVNGPLAGSGTLTIAPLSSGRSIGIAGGGGDLQISQALLDGATGFAQHVIGRADGSGDISAGALQLRAHTRLQTGSGEIALNGAVDGAVDLVLNSGGTTRIAGPVGVGTALRSLVTDNNAARPDWDGSSGERTLVDRVDTSGRARIVTTGAQTYNDPLVVRVPVQFNGGVISATQATNRFDGPVHANATQLDLRSNRAIKLGDVRLANGGNVETDGLLELAGALVLDGGTLSLVTHATPTSVDFTDPELQGRTLTFGLAPITEASATLFQGAGSTLSSAAGSLLVLRSPNGGSLQLENVGNDLRGGISAVSGALGDTSSTRFTTVPLGFVRLVSTEINAVGAPPTDGSQTLQQAGIEGDVLKLSADKITTGPTGQLRARLPFDNSQGSQTSVPGMTLIMSPTALTIGGGFGLATPDGYIQVRVGSDIGGFLTVRPHDVSGDNAFILLAGPEPKPFYDGSGKLTEVRVFYNGDAPRTPQEAGALMAVTAIVEDARQTRFEEAVRTENVKSRLRSGVIAEVGAGRPATVGRESIQMPPSCSPKGNSLTCE